MPRREPRRPTLGLVLVRVALGVLLLHRGWSHVIAPERDGAALRRALDDAVLRTSAVWRWWAEDVLLSNPDAAAFLARWIALLAGIALSFGALTRLASFLGGALCLHVAIYGPPSAQGFATFALVCCAACFFARAGRRGGMDSWLDDHLPGWLTWTRTERPFLA